MPQDEFRSGQRVALRGTDFSRYGRVIRFTGLGKFYGDQYISCCYTVQWDGFSGLIEVSGLRLRRVHPLEELALVSDEVSTPSPRPRMQIDLAKPNG
jgi:hypothetical protein